MHPDTTSHLRKSSTRWAAACSQKPPRKPYTKPGITIGPRDEEDVIEALAARNPYM